MKKMNYYLLIKNERSQIFVLKDFKTRKLKLPKIKISNIDLSKILSKIFKINLNESIYNYIIKDNLIEIMINSINNTNKGIWLSKHYLIEDLFENKSKKYLFNNKIIKKDILTNSKLLFAKIYCKTKLDIYEQINDFINYSINNIALTGCYDGVKCFKFYYRNNSYNKYIRRIRENILQEFVNIYSIKQKNMLFSAK